MTEKLQSPLERLMCPLVGYLYDCLAAQTEWSRAVNVLQQKDIFLVPLTRRQQSRFGKKGSLALSGSEAEELGNRYATGGSDVSLRLGALFLVGRIPLCPTTIARDGGATVQTSPRRHGGHRA